MGYRVELTDRAKSDIVWLFTQIDTAESVRANRWFNGLERALDTLTEPPRRCPAAPEADGKRPLRRLLYGKKPYACSGIYEIDEPAQAVHILTIRHGAMETARIADLS
jgi:plasmid stabilization system protein ParE